MHAPHIVSSNAQISQARIGSAHGYRIDGDRAVLNAEIDLLTGERLAGSALSLQLWACEEPHRGGPLAGFKVAETPIVARGEGARLHHDSVGFARPPAEARDYAMVLVLAAHEGSEQAPPVDFANYPQRQRFLVPHLLGVQREARADGSLLVSSDGVLNPRDEDNLSGSLSLQLWALAAPYAGGELVGKLLTSVDLGQLYGGARAPAAEFSAQAPESASAHVVLVLVEWTAQGYLARDYVNVSAPLAAVVPQPVPEAAAEPVATEPVVAEPVATEPVVAEPVVAEPVVAEPVAAEPARKAPGVHAAPSAPAGASARPAPITAEAGAERPLFSSASASELARVAGISAKLAAQLVKAAPFGSFDDMLRVKGVGDKILQKLRKAYRL